VSWLAHLRTSVRRKLLAMALLPTLVMLPLVVGALLWWGDFVYDKLLVAKVRSDLAVARGYFDHVAERVASGTRGVAGSQALLERLQQEDAQQLAWFLEQQRRRLELDFLVTLPATSPLATAIGSKSGGLVVWGSDHLRQLAPQVHDRAFGAAVAPADDAQARRALVIVTQAEVVDRGRHIASVVGGTLLNHNLDLVDRINGIVYPEGALPLGSQGTTTLFMGDVRVSTNVRLFPNERAIGTRASANVVDAVLAHGRTWLDRAYVVDAWYMSGYEPLVDVEGQRVGMLYVGYLEEPFRLAKWGILGLTVLILVAGTFLTLGLSLRTAATIFRPVERMHQVIRRVEAGDRKARVGAMGTGDEIGRLAEQFDQLLDKVEEHRAAVETWAHELESRVDARTRELANMNRSLQDAQQQLIQSEKLAAIGQVTAAIAHEINNPIAVMQGNLDLLRDLLGDKAASVAPEMRLLDEQVERVRSMVSHLLQSVRPIDYAGFVEELDLCAAIEESLPLASHVRAPSVEVVKDYGVAPRVEFNRGELQQLLVNLLTNALQEMPNGGCLTLRTRTWFEDGRPAGAVAEIQDTGPGIAPDIRDRLFLPLFTTRPHGNGLGLWISLSVVERYGGTIEADNAQSGGAIFRIRLRSHARPRAPAWPLQPA